MYDWRKDSIDSWALAIRWHAITRGFIRPASVEEMYWAEAKGAIP